MAPRDQASRIHGLHGKKLLYDNAQSEVAYILRDHGLPNVKPGTLRVFLYPWAFSCLGMIRALCLVLSRMLQSIRMKIHIGLFAQRWLLQRLLRAAHTCRDWYNGRDIGGWSVLFLPNCRQAWRHYRPASYNFLWINHLCSRWCSSNLHHWNAHDAARKDYCGSWSWYVIDDCACLSVGDITSSQSWKTCMH